MSGHSKWATIHRKKGLLDAERGKIFQKIARELYVAAKGTNGDPADNPNLRLVVEKAKSNNMPKDNIQKAIDKAVKSAGGEDYESVRYMAVMPVGSDELISIVRLEPEPVDSTRVYPVYDISELIKKDICNICLIFRSVWLTDYKQIYLQHLSVINGDYAILRIFWKKTECVYYVYIRNQSSDNLSEWNRITLESHMNKIGNDIWYSTHQVYPNQ